MKILHIAFYTFKRCIIDLKCLISMVVAPLVLIIILGFSLNSTFGPVNYENIKIGVYCTNNQDFLDFSNFIKSRNYRKDIVVERTVSKEEGIKEVQNGSETAMICFNTSQNNKKVISNYVFRRDIGCDIVDNLVNSYKNASTDGSALSGLTRIEVDNKGESPRAIDYYSVTMLIMMIFYSSEVCISLSNEDLFTDVKNRVSSLPISNVRIIIGKIIGFTFASAIWIMSVILITKYIFNVNWGSSLITLFLSILFFSLISSNIGVSCLLLTKSKSTTIYIIQVIVPASTLFSGGYMQLQYFGDELKKLSNLMPSYAIQNIIFNDIYKGYCENVNIYYEILFGLFIATSVIIILLGRRPVK